MPTTEPFFLLRLNGLALVPIGTRRNLNMEIKRKHLKGNRNYNLKGENGTYKLGPAAGALGASVPEVITVLTRVNELVLSSGSVVVKTYVRVIVDVYKFGVVTTGVEVGEVFWMTAGVGEGEDEVGIGVAVDFGDSDDVVGCVEENVEIDVGDGMEVVDVGNEEDARVVDGMGVMVDPNDELWKLELS
jgi:hypothetical protein